MVEILITNNYVNKYLAYKELRLNSSYLKTLVAIKMIKQT